MRRILVAVISAFSFFALSLAASAATVVTQAYGKGSSQAEACKNAKNKAIALAGGGLVNQQDCFDCENLDGYTWQCLAIVKVSRPEFNNEDD